MSIGDSLTTQSGVATSAQSHEPIYADGPMAESVRLYPWENTLLGAMSGWSETLLCAVNLMLESQFPTLLFWGPEMIVFYNDAYQPLLAEKHPQALGKPVKDCWPEAWHIIGPQCEAVLQSGKKFLFENVLIPVLRHGELCDVYWTYNYSPVRGPGGAIVGTFIVAHDVTAKLAAERERDAMAANLKNVLESTTDGLAVLDTQWRYSYINTQGARMLGVCPEDLLGKSLWELYPHAAETEFGREYRRAVETQKPRHVTAFYPEPLNAWLECHCYPSEYGLSVYFRDVTEQREAEQRLQLGEARYRSLVHATADIISTGKVEGASIAETAQFQAFTGLTAEQIRGLGWADAIHPDDREKVIARWLQSIETGSMFELEHRLRRHDGVWRTMLVRAVPVRDATGEIVDWISAHTDITERKLAEEENKRLVAAAQQERDRLMALVSSISDEVWFSDAQGNLTWANPVALREFAVNTAGGIEIQKLVEGLEVLRSDSSPRPLEEAPPLRALRGEIVKNEEEIVRTPATGELRHRQIGSSPVRDADGQIIGSVSVVRDITERRRAEDALRQAQSRFRKLFESDMMGIAIPDRFGAFRESNDELLRMTGYTRADQDAGLVRWDTMTPPEYADLDREHIREAAERGSCTPYEKEYIRKDGTRVPILCGYALLEGSQDEYVGFVLDLSGQKRTERELREREERFHALAESLPQLIWMADTKGATTYCNRRVAEYFGIPSDELATVSWRRRLHPDDVDRVFAAWWHSVETLEPYQVEYRLRRHDGEYRTFLVRALAVRNEAGEVDRWIGTATDIHDQKLAEDALREREERFRVLAESLPQMVWIRDAGGQYIYCNQRLLDYVGRPAEWLQRQAWEAIHPDDVETTLQKWKLSIETGVPYENEYRLLRHDGVYRWFLVRGVPIRNESGQIQRWLGSSTDVQDQKLAEEALRRTEKLTTAGRFAASMAHEINNPLSAVVNTVYLALRDRELSESTRSLLESADRELARVGQYITQTLRFHKQSTARSDADLGEIMDSVLAMYAPRFRSSSIRVQKQYRTHEKLSCFNSELRQVFANLIGNALDAIGEKGQIQVRIHPARSWTGPVVRGIRVVVTDTGAGIPSKLRAQLFEPFFSTKESTGVGLGLWVSQGIVQQHNGRITLRTSTHPARHGTVFSVFFPFPVCAE